MNFTKNDHYVEIAADAIVCGSTVKTGVWTAQGDKLVLQYSDGQQESYNYGTANETLTHSKANCRYPVVDNDGIVYAYGDINMIFTKE